MAHVLKAKGHKKSRIILLDAKDAFSKQAVFMESWQKHYPGMIEWQDAKMHGGVKSVDPKAMTVVTGLATYKAALVNVIPAQMAGKIARDAGLANPSGFCPINPENMKSTIDPNIYIVGNACIPGDMPKSAFAANSQAKVAAMMIRGELVSARTFPARYTNTCWSFIETNDTVKVGAATRRRMARSPPSKPSSPRPARAPSCASKRRTRTWVGTPDSRPTSSRDDLRAFVRTRQRRGGPGKSSLSGRRKSRLPAPRPRIRRR